MGSAIWMILYDLDQAGADQYLHWFDTVHIPEKLDRPGYTWAAHYRLTDAAGMATDRYLAMFGARDSRVFYNPSPAQIKPNQPPETRAMMAWRSNSQMFILAREWRRDNGGCADPQDSAIAADWIRLAILDAPDNDEDLGAWLVQDEAANPAAVSTQHKFLVSTGTARHVLLQELNVGSAPCVDLFDPGETEWSQRVADYLSYPAGTPLLAQRVWPKVAGG